MLGRPRRSLSRKTIKDLLNQKKIDSLRRAWEAASYSSVKGGQDWDSLFSRVDIRKSNELDLDKTFKLFRKTLRMSKLAVTDEEVDGIFSYIDVDSNGGISKDELFEFFRKIQKLSTTGKKEAAPTPVFDDTEYQNRLREKDDLLKAMQEERNRLILEHQEEIDSLNAAHEVKLKELQDKLDSLLNELNKTRDELKNVKRELKDAQELLDSTKDALKKTKDQLENLLNELAATKDELEKTKDELRSTQDELKNTQDELKNTRDELTATQDELERTKEELKKTQDELASTKDELYATKEELKNTQEELAETEYELSKTKDLLASTIDQLRTLQAKEIEGITSAKNKLDVDLGDAEQSLQSGKDTLEGLWKELLKHKEDGTAHDKTIGEVMALSQSLFANQMAYLVTIKSRLSSSISTQKAGQRNVSIMSELQEAQAASVVGKNSCNEVVEWSSLMIETLPPSIEEVMDDQRAKQKQMVTMLTEKVNLLLKEHTEELTLSLEGQMAKLTEKTESISNANIRVKGHMTESFKTMTSYCEGTRDKIISWAKTDEEHAETVDSIIEETQASRSKMKEEVEKFVDHGNEKQLQSQTLISQTSRLMSSCEVLKASSDGDMRINRKAKGHLGLLTKQINFTRDFVSFDEENEEVEESRITAEEEEILRQVKEEEEYLRIEEAKLEADAPTTDLVAVSADEPTSDPHMEMNGTDPSTLPVGTLDVESIPPHMDSEA